MDMFQKYFLFLFLFAFFFSCAETETKKEPVAVEKAPEPLLIINDSFLLSPMNFEITPANLLATYPDDFKISTKATRNKYVDGLIDSIKTYTSDGSPSDYFQFYETQGKEFFFRCVLRTNHISLRNDLVVGMKKADFARKMKVDSIYNCVSITNTTQTSSWFFYFHNSRLDSIVFSGYLE